MASILAAGLDGIEKGCGLPPPVQVTHLMSFFCISKRGREINLRAISLSCRPQVDPKSIDPDSGQHVPPHLPTDPMESISRLLNKPEGQAIRQALGEKAIDLITGMCTS